MPFKGSVVQRHLVSLLKHHKCYSDASTCAQRMSKTICRVSKTASQKNYFIKNRKVSERNKFIFILGYEKLSFVSLFSLAPINFSLSFHFEIFYLH